MLGLVRVSKDPDDQTDQQNPIPAPPQPHSSRLGANTAVLSAALISASIPKCLTAFWFMIFCSCNAANPHLLQTALSGPAIYLGKLLAARCKNLKP